jgi:hypothetical protein
MTIARRLKDQLLAVSRKIGFRIFTAEGQLPDIAQMLFLGQPKRLPGRWELRRIVGRLFARDEYCSRERQGYQCDYRFH